LRGVLTDMIYRLAKGVQVRKEDWGLLFYSQAASKIYFVKSGDWLHPAHSDGRFQPDSLGCNEADAAGIPPEHSVKNLITYLMERDILVNEP
jgi:putative mycofactocin binding protein MftB